MKEIKIGDKINKPYYRRGSKYYFRSDNGERLVVEHSEAGVYKFTGTPFSTTIDFNDIKIEIKTYD